MASFDVVRRLQQEQYAVTEREPRVLHSAVAASVTLAVLIQVYAGASLRGLYADGAFYATQLAAHQAELHPARLMSSMIVEWPVMVAVRLGVQTPHGVAFVYSLITNLMPGVIILLCLPAMSTGERHFFIFPAFVYFAGTLSAQFASVTEGLVATSYFWLLLCLVTFGRLTILRLVLIAMLAVGILDVHEQTSFLGPILFVSCAIRWRGEPRLLPRVILALVAVSALAGTVTGVYFILRPFSADDRDTLVAHWLALRWLYEPDLGYNLPCVIGMLAVPCILLTTVRPAWGRLATWMFAASSVPLAFAAFWLDWLIAPVTQWEARDNGALMSLPLASLLLFARVHTPLATAMTRTTARGIVAILGLAVSLWHVAATEQWSAFLLHFSNVLKTRDGIIAWESVVAPPASRQAALALKMGWEWTNPDLSLVALRRSCIDSIIANPAWYTDWEPHTLLNLATMPAIPGVTYTYLLPSDQQRAACPATQ